MEREGERRGREGGQADGWREGHETILPAHACYNLLMYMYMCTIVQSIHIALHLLQTSFCIVEGGQANIPLHLRPGGLVH